MHDPTKLHSTNYNEGCRCDKCCGWKRYAVSQKIRPKVATMCMKFVRTQYPELYDQMVDEAYYQLGAKRELPGPKPNEPRDSRTNQ